MKVNWFRRKHGENDRNFGDILGPILLRHYGVPVEFAPLAEADIITVGSILQRVPEGWTGTILGSGFIRPGLTRDLSRARVLAVRGALTRDACQLPASTPLGDPGILAIDLLDETTPQKRIPALLVPHYVDTQLRRRHPRLPVGDICGMPGTLLQLIARAELVYTSSLHGLIAADALGVPHVLEPHERVRGGLFKFQDYASAFGEEIRPGVARLTQRDRMAERQEEIRELFRSLAAGWRQENSGGAGPSPGSDG